MNITKKQYQLLERHFQEKFAKEEAAKKAPKSVAKKSSKPVAETKKTPKKVAKKCSEPMAADKKKVVKEEFTPTADQLISKLEKKFEIIKQKVRERLK